jgi:ribosomal-protein-alanine N-acetyltransferase
MHQAPRPEPDAAPLLRHMLARDLDQVMVIERTFSAPWTREMFHQELHQSDVSDSLVAQIDDQVVGYVLWWYVVDEVHIVNVAVHPTHRRQGVARRLLQALFERAAARGMAIATLEVRVRNEPAIRLYDSLGFRQIAIRKGYYADNGEDALVMLKSLRPETG